MKKLFSLLLLFASIQCRAGQQGAALLWLPQGEGWEAALETALQNKNFRLTLAVSPTAVSKETASKLAAPASKNQLELALRASGDPVFPLLFSPASPAVYWQGKPEQNLWSDRLDEAAALLFSAADEHKKAFGQPAAGWVPAAGGLTPELAALAQACGLKWAATGKEPGDFTVVYSSRTALAPFAVIADTASLEAALSSAAAMTVFAVIDESAPDYAGNGRELLAQAASAQAEWLTVSQALARKLSTETLSSENFPPPWSGDYSAWAENPRQAGAFAALDSARKDLSIYKTAGKKESLNAVQAAEYFSELQSGNIFLRLADADSSQADETEREFKAALEAVYQLMGASPPPALLLPLSRSGSADERAGVSTGTASITAGENSLVLKNPEKTAAPPQNSEGEAVKPEKFSGIDSLSISWDESKLRFCLRFTPAEAVSRQFLADVYIDLNHRLRSGSTALLESRRLSAAPDDGWELAVSLNQSQARLFRAAPRGSDFAGGYPVSETAEGDFCFELPRQTIKGSPELWGYLALVMEQGEEPGKERPFRPLIPSAGETVSDRLAADKIGNALYFLRLPKKF